MRAPDSPNRRKTPPPTSTRMRARPSIHTRLPALARPSRVSGPPDPSTCTATRWPPQFACAATEQVLAVKTEIARLRWRHWADRSTGTLLSLELQGNMICLPLAATSTRGCCCESLENPDRLRQRRPAHRQQACGAWPDQDGKHRMVQARRARQCSEPRHHRHRVPGPHLAEQRRQVFVCGVHRAGRGRYSARSSQGSRFPRPRRIRPSCPAMACWSMAAIPRRRSIRPRRFDSETVAGPDCAASPARKPFR